MLQDMIKIRIEIFMLKCIDRWRYTRQASMQMWTAVSLLVWFFLIHPDILLSFTLKVKQKKNNYDTDGILPFAVRIIISQQNNTLYDSWTGIHDGALYRGFKKHVLSAKPIPIGWKVFMQSSRWYWEVVLTLQRFKTETLWSLLLKDIPNWFIFKSTQNRRGTALFFQTFSVCIV